MKTAVTKRASKEQSHIEVLEAGACPSLTRQSTIRYEVGKDSDSALHLRIVSNSGRGKFHRKFIPLAPVLEALEKAKPPITSGTLRAITKHMSANQSGFLLSIVLSKGLIERLPGKERGYVLTKRLSSGAKPLALPATSGASAKPLKAKAVSKAKSR